MHRGYTKRWRMRWDKGYHQDRLLWVLMDYFIDFAAYIDKEVFKKNVGKIQLKRGQWYFTYRGLAKFMAVNTRRIRTSMSVLSKIGFLTLQPTQQYTIVTVNNYDTYQPLVPSGDTPNDTEQTQNRHRPDTPLISTKKGNKEKKVKKYIPGDFRLDKKLKIYALDRNVDPEKVDELFESFKDYHVAKGTKLVDWNRSWFTWVRNAPEFSKWAMKKKGDSADEFRRVRERLSSPDKMV